ncbi:MAG: 5-formyltetrahydrofolate cyclo-ligase [Butyrivibrio sp.]|jgi:5-formyltetrahydrofolate cyclo-ligase|nr:5-formyltetrahydrofolate cyclo-ligase [Butyrivibrio sp.]
MKKEDYRKLAIERRNRLTPEERENRSSKIAISLMASENWKQAERLLIYCSYLSEVSTRGLISQAIRAHKKVYCPRITDAGQKQMEFYRIHDISDLRAGFKEIPEPVTQEVYMTQDYSDSEKGTTLVVLPGVAFDKECNRIGYNGGYYDRYLVRIPYAAKVAICFSCQLFAETLPTDPHDVRAEMIVTEDHVYRNL